MWISKGINFCPGLHFFLKNITLSHFHLLFVFNQLLIKSHWQETRFCHEKQQSQVSKTCLGNGQIQPNQEKEKKFAATRLEKRLCCGYNLCAWWEIFETRHFFGPLHRYRLSLYIGDLWRVKIQTTTSPLFLKLKWSGTDWTFLTVFGLPSLHWCHPFLFQDFSWVCTHNFQRAQLLCAFLHQFLSPLSRPLVWSIRHGIRKDPETHALQQEETWSQLSNDAHLSHAFPVHYSLGDKHHKIKVFPNECDSMKIMFAESLHWSEHFLIISHFEKAKSVIGFVWLFFHSLTNSWGNESIAQGKAGLQATVWQVVVLWMFQTEREEV